MTTTFIVNPVAGRGKSLTKWRRFYPLLKQENFDFDVLYSNKPQEIIKLAREARDNGSDVIFAVGGDGSLREAADALVGSDVSLGQIPFGTGNDFIRSLNIPREIPAILEMIRQKPRRTVDLARLNDKIYCNVAGIGFDGEVIAASDNVFKRLGGTAAYVAAVLRAVFFFQAPRMQVFLDGVLVEKKLHLVAIGNGCFYGGGMNILPGAKQDDGFLDVCMVDSVSPLRLLSRLPGIYTGNHVNQPEVSMAKVRQVRIVSDPPVLVQADGDLVGTTPVDIEIIPAGLQFISY